MIPYRKIADTPWLWAGRTKEVKTSGDSNDPGGYRILAAIEERVCKAKIKAVLFRIPFNRYFST